MVEMFASKMLLVLFTSNLLLSFSSGVSHANDHHHLPNRSILDLIMEIKDQIKNLTRHVQAQDRKIDDISRHVQCQDSKMDDISRLVNTQLKKMSNQIQNNTAHIEHVSGQTETILHQPDTSKTVHLIAIGNSILELRLEAFFSLSFILMSM